MYYILFKYFFKDCPTAGNDIDNIGNIEIDSVLGINEKTLTYDYYLSNGLCLSIFY